MAVPTHFYKVVLAESRSRLPFGAPKVSVGAFVMPNDQIQPDMSLTAFSVPLEMLENVAGAVLTSLTSCPCLLYHVCLLCLLQGIGLFPGFSKRENFPSHSVHDCLVAACRPMTASLHHSACACASATACNVTAVVQAACKLRMHSPCSLPGLPCWLPCDRPHSNRVVPNNMGFCQQQCPAHVCPQCNASRCRNEVLSRLCQ